MMVVFLYAPTMLFGGFIFRYVPSWLLTIIFIFVLYIIACWMIRCFSKTTLQGKKPLTKTVIIASAILPLVLIGFLGRGIFYEAFVLKPAVTFSDKMSDFAESRENIFLCNLVVVGDKRNHCRYAIATTKRDPSLCDTISKDNGRNVCYDTLGACSKIEDRPFQEACYKKLARLQKDASICERSWQHENKDRCLIGVAVAAIDLSICYNKVSALKDECISQVIVEKQIYDPSASDADICRELKYGKNDCLFAIAMKTENTALCQELSNHVDVPYTKDTIYGIYHTRDDCYYDFAIYSDKYKGDYSFCNKIEEDYRRSRCFREVAEETGNFSLCANINEEETMNSCYREIAADKKDLTICDYIQDEDFREGCYYRVNVQR